MQTTRGFLKIARFFGFCPTLHFDKWILNLYSVHEKPLANFYDGVDLDIGFFVNFKMNTPRRCNIWIETYIYIIWLYSIYFGNYGENTKILHISFTKYQYVIWYKGFEFQFLKGDVSFWFSKKKKLRDRHFGTQNALHPPYDVYFFREFARFRATQSALRLVK